MKEKIILNQIYYSITKNKKILDRAINEVYYLFQLNFIFSHQCSYRRVIVIFFHNWTHKTKTEKTKLIDLPEGLKFHLILQHIFTSPWRDITFTVETSGACPSDLIYDREYFSIFNDHPVSRWVSQWLARFACPLSPRRRLYPLLFFVFLPISSPASATSPLPTASPSVPTSVSSEWARKTERVFARSYPGKGWRRRRRSREGRERVEELAAGRTNFVFYSRI